MFLNIWTQLLPVQPVHHLSVSERARLRQRPTMTPKIFQMPRLAPYSSRSTGTILDAIEDEFKFLYSLLGFIRVSAGISIDDFNLWSFPSIRILLWTTDALEVPLASSCDWFVKTFDNDFSQEDKAVQWVHWEAVWIFPNLFIFANYTLRLALKTEHQVQREWCKYLEQANTILSGQSKRKRNCAKMKTSKENNKFQRCKSKV